MGFRTEELYGEGYADPVSVINHEIFELENSDILDTLSESIPLNSFDEYNNGDIILSDMGKAGKLYGYTKTPKHVKNIVRNTND